MISEGDQSKVGTQKIIHAPTQDELEHMGEFLKAISISGADRVLLIWGRDVFEEDWISDETKNWLAVLDADMAKYEDSKDELGQRLFAIMVELDYKALRGCLYMDAMYASAKIEDMAREQEKVNG